MSSQFDCIGSNTSQTWQIIQRSDGSTELVCPVGSTIQQTEKITVDDLFKFPVTTDLQDVWWQGFLFPLSLYLVAYCYQVVIGMFETSKEE